MLPSSSIRPLPSSCDPAAQIGLAVQEIRTVESNDLAAEQNPHSASSQQYDVMPPGVESPPPPGCENDLPSVAHKRHNRDADWTFEHKSDKETVPEQRQSRRQVSRRHIVEMVHIVRFQYHNIACGLCVTGAIAATAVR